MSVVVEIHPEVQPRVSNPNPHEMATPSNAKTLLFPRNESDRRLSNLAAFLGLVGRVGGGIIIDINSVFCKILSVVVVPEGVRVRCRCWIGGVRRLLKLYGAQLSVFANGALAKTAGKGRSVLRSALVTRSYKF